MVNITENATNLLTTDSQNATASKTTNTRSENSTVFFATNWEIQLPGTQMIQRIPRVPQLLRPLHQPRLHPPLSSDQTVSTPSGSIHLDFYLCTSSFSVYQTSSGCFYLSPRQFIAYNDADACQGQRGSPGTFINLDQPEVKIMSSGPGYGHEYWLGCSVLKTEVTYGWPATKQLWKPQQKRSKRKH